MGHRYSIHLIQMQHMCFTNVHGSGRINQTLTLNFSYHLCKKTNAGDAWSYVANKSFAISFMDGSQACSYENIEILVPTWSGSRYLSLYIRSALSSTEGRLHQLKMDDGSFASGNESYTNTFVSATSLRSY